MLQVLVIGFGGFLGTIARFGLGGLVHKHFGGSFPLGTLVINVLGCLVIGVLMYLIEDRSLFGPTARLFLTIGLLGGFTTFSSFSYETVEQLRDGDTWFAVINVCASVILGLGAVCAGRALMKAIGV
jgi:CrcB protein